MSCTINLRHDQHFGLVPKSQEEGITIYAPEWVHEGLRILAIKLHGVTFNICDGLKIMDAFTLTDSNMPLTLVQLQKIARNEERNTSGVINKSNYKPGIADDRVIYALKDLVRQCIIVGLDETTHFGGYGSERIKQEVMVYIVDLIGLQFQQPWNTGRLVLSSKSGGYEGCLDQLIYENVVGEPRKSFIQVEELKQASPEEFSRRYVSVDHETYFDVVAYKKFIATDVMLCILGLNDTVNKRAQATDTKKFNVHFKFLKYGSGYFAWRFSHVIRQHILDGVIDGLERLLGCYKELSTLPLRITSFEFPFFQCLPHEKNRLDILSKKHSFQYTFGQMDALKMTASPKNYILATTNCADPHAATGNEMGFSSVDSAIAENLKSRGHIFNPLLNSKIQSQFVKLL